MKTRIITLAIASLFLSINSASAIEETNDTLSKSKTTISFSGNQNKIKQGDNKSVSKYDQDGSLIEKTTYTWYKGKWVSTGKYEWFYSDSKVLDKVLYVQWDEVNAKWNNKAIETQYFYNSHRYITTVEREIDY